MHFHEVDDRRYAAFERLRKHPGLAHAFSTRPFDVAPRADGRGAERSARRRQMAVDLGLEPDRLAYCIQVHGAELKVVDESLAPGPLEGVDAAISALPGAALMTFSADCPLVLVYDPVRHALGMVHASWRCTVAAATRRLVQAMRNRLGSNPADLLAGIGPGAGPCCYEVGSDVVEAAANLPEPEALFEKRNERVYFDLWRANRAQLIAAGVRPQNVETAEICTLCANDLFYSYRREGAGCGHFGLMAGLREPDRAAS